MIRVNNLIKTYTNSKGPVHALAGVDLAINEGDFVVVHGASGSGKTTLLMALGGMLRPTSGSVAFRGLELYRCSPWRRNRYRQNHVGFVFQKFFLLPYLTAFDNIRMSLALRRYDGDHKQRILELATRLRMADRLTHRPPQLSVGEQQRIAMARAIAAEPEIILADEPTGNLDQANAEAFAQFLTDENRRGRTIVLVTHDARLLNLGNRRVQLDSGRLCDA